MKKTILLILIAAVALFVIGCGPGQPFEIVAGDHNARKALELWSLLTSAKPPID